MNSQVVASLDSERQRSRAVSTKVGRLSPKNKKLSTNRQTERQTYIQTDKWTGRHANRQAPLNMETEPNFFSVRTATPFLS